MRYYIIENSEMDIKNQLLLLAHSKYEGRSR